MRIHKTTVGPFKIALYDKEESQDLFLVFPGFCQKIEEGGWSLPGELGLPFPEWTSFHENPFDVCYVQAPYRNWTTGNLWLRRKLFKDILNLATFLKDFSLYKRLFMAGFSDGATLCNYLTVESPALFSGALIHSGLWIEGNRKAEKSLLEVPAKKIPVALISGNSGSIERHIARQSYNAFSFYRKNGFPVSYLRDENFTHSWNKRLVADSLKFLGF